MTDTENNPSFPLSRSKTEGRISVSGNGIQGFSSPGGDLAPEGRLLFRSRTEVATPASASLSGKEFDVDHVLYEISRKVVANKKSLLYLFRNNDPAGRGSITREALHRIVRVLYGFLTSDQFGKLLRRMNIHNRSQITYDVFMACFEDAEAMQKRYLRRELLEPFWKAASSGPEENAELIDRNDERRYLDVATGMEQRSRSADDRLSHLKKRLFDALPAIHETFPHDEPKDLLLTSKMLRTVLEKAGIAPSVDEANVLWDRLDTARCGLVPLRRFYTFVDPLSENRKPETAPASSFPAPNRSQFVPRLALGAKKGLTGTRSLNHYHYPQPDATFAPLETKPEDTATQPSPPRPTAALPHVHHISKSLALPASRKRPLILEADRPVLAQLVARLVEPREQFMAFCRRFDDEHGAGRIALGQLLGCLLFCGKTVADPLVNLLLQKMGIKAEDSGSGENGENKKYDYKSIGCAIYDADSNRVLANLLQNPEHYYRLLRSEICMDWCETEPTNYETLEVKFIKFMYSDIIRLIAELRRLDRNNSGIVNEKDFESAMSRIFNTSFTRKQLVELTRGAVSDDGVMISEIVKTMFTTAQPEICRMIAMSSSKRQAVAQQKTTQQEQPPPPVPTEPAETTMAADAAKIQQQQGGQTATMSTFGVATEMTEEQAVDLFKQIMKDRFHTFDKQFIALDVKQTKRISQFQLHQILRNMNVHINMRELGYMWKYVPVDSDGLCSYRRFLLHFISNGQNNMFGTARQQKQQKANENVPTATQNSSSQPVVNSEVEQQIAKQEKQLQVGEIDQVLECIRPDVCRHWGILKERIRQEDASGAGNFDTERLSAVIKGSGIDITEEALSYLSRKYTSIVRNKRRFFYMPFMRYFTRRFIQDANNGIEHKCSCN